MGVSLYRCAAAPAQRAGGDGPASTRLKKTPRIRGVIFLYAKGIALQECVKPRWFKLGRN